MKLDQRALRDMFGHYATGVAVVTARDTQGQACGVTISSFNTASLSPELVLFSLTNSLLSLPTFEAARHIGINFLAADQQDVSRVFASRGADKWSGVDVSDGDHDVPLIGGALAHMECERFQVMDAGDHRLFLCKVLGFETFSHKPPLVFFKGRYCELTSSPNLNA